MFCQKKFLKFFKIHRKNIFVGVSFFKKLQSDNLKLSEAATGDIRYKKMWLKFRKFLRKTPVLDYLFNKVAVPRDCNFLKNTSTHAFLWNLQDFQE